MRNDIDFIQLGVIIKTNRPSIALFRSDEGRFFLPIMKLMDRIILI